MKEFVTKRFKVVPSERYEDWNDVLGAEELDLERLQELMWLETPGVTFYEMQSYLTGVRPHWRPTHRVEMNACEASSRTSTKGISTAMEKHGKSSPQNGISSTFTTKGATSSPYVKPTLLPLHTAAVQTELDMFRARMGPDQRALDVQWLRRVRREGHLSLVLGGGPRVLRGNIGFLWSLVVHLIASASVLAANMGGPWRGCLHADWQLLQNAPFSSSAVCSAAADCAVFYGEALFANVMHYTYMLFNAPGKVHRAVAELAEPVSVGNHVQPGLTAIVTQGIDDLVGEAIDDLGIRRRTMTMMCGQREEMDNGQFVQTWAKSTRAARKKRTLSTQKMFHVSGWLPRRMRSEVIQRGVERLLQGKQGEQNCRRRYGSPTDKDEALAETQLGMFLPDPSFVEEALSAALESRESQVLFLGVSFDDPMGEGVLKRVTEFNPSRRSYSLLRWPVERAGSTYQQSSSYTIREISKMFVERSVQPVWFDSADEIPDILRLMS